MEYYQYLLYKVVLRIKQVSTHKTLRMALDVYISSAQDMLATVLSTLFGPRCFFYSLNKGVSIGMSPLRTNKRCLGNRP